MEEITPKIPKIENEDKEDNLEDEFEEDYYDDEEYDEEGDEEGEEDLFRENPLKAIFLLLKEIREML